MLSMCVASARAQTAEELVNDGKNTDNVTTYGMGYDQKRHSALRQINTRNVKRLVPVWNVTLSNLLGEQEKQIRTNPTARATDLLKEVFKR